MWVVLDFYFLDLFQDAGQQGKGVRSASPKLYGTVVERGSSQRRILAKLPEEEKMMLNFLAYMSVTHSIVS